MKLPHDETHCRGCGAYMDQACVPGCAGRTIPLQFQEAAPRGGGEADTKMLADCFRMAGADCDGNEDWRIAPRALQAVTDLRRDYGEACDEAHELRTQLSALRSRVEGLVAKWDDSYRVVRQNCADELRELLSAGGAANG